MKRIIINIILISLFILLGMAIVSPFLAEAEFNAGKALEANYRWKMADERFDLAVRFDPLSAEYHADMGRLYTERAVIFRNKIPVLLKAEKEYKKVHELNPYNARCLVGLAVAEEELFLADTDEYSDRLESSMSHFKEAFEKDPHHYIFNYDIGRNFLRVWGYLGNKDKQFALGCFKHCLELKPPYYQNVYSKLWRRVKDFKVMLEITPENLKAYENLYSFLIKNNLWEFRKETLNKIEEYKKREQPELFAQEKEEKEKLLRELYSLATTEGETGWVGKSASGNSTYKNGNMYWTGTANTVINIPKGKAIVKIQAKGSPAYGVWPYMIVELEGEKIGETFVNSSEWKEYPFIVNTDGGLKVLSVTFPNDDGNLEKGIDRNLYVGEVRVEHEK